MINKNIQDVVAEFERAFRDYLDASIAYAEVQEPYQPLSSEDEIKWLKERLTTTLTQLVKEVEVGAKEEQKQRDVFLVRTSGWHVAEKLARKLLGGKNVNWYTQEQLDKAIQETNRSWLEDPMTQQHYEEIVRKAVDPERTADKAMRVFLDMWPPQIEMTRHIMNEARAKLEEVILKP